MKKNIGYLSGAPRVTTRPTGESGGARAHVLGVTNAYQHHGWQIKPFIFGDQVDFEGKSSSTLKDVLLSNAVGRVVADLARIGLSKKNSLNAFKQIGTDVDYVYERFAVFQALGKPFKAAGVPWIIETQGLFYHEARFDRKSISLARLAKKMEIATYHDCDIIIAVSDVLKNLLVSQTGVNPNKVIVVPNGVDTTKFAPSKAMQQQPNPSAIPVIGFVGGLLRWQGVDFLLKAIALAKKSGSTYKAIIVGDGDERTALTNLAKELKIDDIVTFTGRVSGDSVPSYIEKFDLCFSGQLPSAIGGMYHSPLKIYEYMAMGKPVLASNFADARSVITGKGTGFLFEAGDLDSLTSALIECHSKRHEFAKMGHMAREEIVRSHSWNARVSDMISEIDSILVRN